MKDMDFLAAIGEIDDDLIDAAINTQFGNNNTEKVRPAAEKHYGEEIHWEDSEPSSLPVEGKNRRALVPGLLALAAAAVIVAVVLKFVMPLGNPVANSPEADASTEDGHSEEFSTDKEETQFVSIKLLNPEGSDTDFIGNLSEKTKEAILAGLRQTEHKNKSEEYYLPRVLLQNDETVIALVHDGDYTDKGLPYPEIPRLLLEIRENQGRWENVNEVYGNIEVIGEEVSRLFCDYWRAPEEETVKEILTALESDEVLSPCFPEAGSRSGQWKEIRDMIEIYYDDDMPKEAVSEQMMRVFGPESIVLGEDAFVIRIRKTEEISEDYPNILGFFELFGADGEICICCKKLSDGRYLLKADAYAEGVIIPAPVSDGSIIVGTHTLNLAFDGMNAGYRVVIPERELSFEEYVEAVQDPLSYQANCEIYKGDTLVFRFYTTEEILIGMSYDRQLAQMREQGVLLDEGTTDSYDYYCYQRNNPADPDRTEYCYTGRFKGKEEIGFIAVSDISREEAEKHLGSMVFWFSKHSMRIDNISIDIDGNKIDMICYPEQSDSRLNIPAIVSYTQTSDHDVTQACLGRYYYPDEYFYMLKASKTVRECIENNRNETELVVYWE